jgi:DNA processing protein
VVAAGEPAYPRLLKEIADPPQLLFHRGTLHPGDAKAIALVGSRRASLAGARIARELSGALAGCGFTVVSGLARGIDTAAHRGALDAGGRTIAVLGSGIDIIYPRENRKLASEIERSGTLVSELPPGTQPKRHTFPRRNRIISGLSLGTVVVEAGPSSGALITAGCALEQNRSVFAVPGTPGFEGSEGTNRLIKEGATLVESARDIVEELMPQIELPFQGTPGRSDRNCISPAEEEVMGLLGRAPAHVDEISRALGESPSHVVAILLLLETRGLIVSLPGKFYART